MSLQKLGNEQFTHYDCEIVHSMHIHSRPAEVTVEVADPCETRKKRSSSECAVLVLSHSV